MNEQYRDIEDIITRFFDGQTSGREEQELYAFFRREDIPGHLRQYTTVFRYFEKGIIEEVSAQKDENSNLPVVKKQVRNKWVIIFAVAASVLLLLLVKPIFMHDNFNPYQGSFIMVNGEKSFDIDEIKAKEAEIERLIAQKEKELEQIYHFADKKMDELSEIEEQFNN